MPVCESLVSILCQYLFSKGKAISMVQKKRDKNGLEGYNKLYICIFIVDNDWKSQYNGYCHFENERNYAHIICKNAQVNCKM